MKTPVTGGSSVPASTLTACALVACALGACAGVNNPNGPNGGSGGNIVSGAGGNGGRPTAGTGGDGGRLVFDGGGDMDCGHREFDLMRNPAELFLVLDRSASMKDDSTIDENIGTPFAPAALFPSKWSDVVPALTEVIDATNASVAWGMKTFPVGEMAACSAATIATKIDVPLAANNSAAVTAAIRAEMPNGNGTPTGDAIIQAVAYLKTLNTDTRKYILLATDGEPSCPSGQDAAFTYAHTAITNAANDGYHTFVVGVATQKETPRARLNMMAVAGREPKVMTNPFDTQFYLALNRAELATAVQKITAVIQDCHFSLGTPPPVPENIAVKIGGEKAPQDPTHTNGWDYTDATHTAVEVHGSWCDAIMTSANRVEFVFACRGEIIP